jgi:hypothetical protein
MTAEEAWAEIPDIFAADTRARSVKVRLALATTKKGAMTITEYVNKMRSLGDDMKATEKSLDNDEMVAYILNSLDHEFDSIVSAVMTRVEPITVAELYSQLLSFENRIDLKTGGGSSSSNGSNSSSYVANRGRGGRGRGGGCHGNRGRGNSGRGQEGSRPQLPQNSKERCQVCFKKGHAANGCWHRFDENYVPDEKLVGAAYNSYDVDTNWYTDTGASDHITSNLEKLSVREKYKGNDQIHTASGAGMKISHIGHIVVPTSSRNLYLKNVLHVPDAAKNLVSVHHLVQDNSVFLEFHPEYFLVKDQATKNTILRGRCHKGLYPLPSSHPIKQAYGAVKPTFARWHSRLVHPSSPIVSRVASSNKLPCSFESNKESVCDACQKAKSHQLPYAKSSSTSSYPLELIYSDVWGHAPDSVGAKRYFVSFIDDYSKFTWIYLLKFKSEVFEKFHEFQNLVERLFDHKILTMQTDWGGEYQKLHSFFEKGHYPPCLLSSRPPTKRCS